MKEFVYKSPSHPKDVSWIDHKNLPPLYYELGLRLTELIQKTVLERPTLDSVTEQKIRQLSIVCDVFAQRAVEVAQPFLKTAKNSHRIQMLMVLEKMERNVFGIFRSRVALPAGLLELCSFENGNVVGIVHDVRSPFNGLQVRLVVHFLQIQSHRL